MVVDEIWLGLLETCGRPVLSRRLALGAELASWLFRAAAGVPSARFR